MSAVPFPRIWIPPRRKLWIPGVRDVMGWIQRDPTTGAGKRNPDTGSAVQGTSTNNSCCCGQTPPTHIQAKRCTDNTDQDIWIASAGLTLPMYFQVDGDDATYYVDDTCNTSASPGTVITDWTEVEDCPQYIQAKNCADGSNADLWFDLDDPVLNLPTPFYFQIGSARYFVNGSCNTSNSPGTIASTYTVVSQCPTSGACCSGSFTPRTAIATISSLVYCTYTGDPHFVATDYSGAYELENVPGTCLWIKEIGAVAGSVGTGVPAYTNRLVLSYNSGPLGTIGWFLRLDVSYNSGSTWDDVANDFYSSDLYNCSVGHTLNIITGDVECPENGAGPYHSGTASITWGDT